MDSYAIALSLSIFNSSWVENGVAGGGNSMGLILEARGPFLFKESEDFSLSDLGGLHSALKRTWERYALLGTKFEGPRW